jgi:mono/diheme cytochrome c family protein
MNGRSEHLRTSSARALKASALLAGIALVATLGARSAAQPPAPNTVWLDQNWTEAQRGAYHHQSQGTLTLPIPTSWFMALQQPDVSPSAGLFSDPAYLARFGFLASPRSSANPNGLPIGFATTVGIDPRNGERFDGIGFTCAACHTGRIDYRGTTMLVDGGPAMINLSEFGTKLGLALGMTMTPTRFNRFAGRVIQGGSLSDRLRRRAELRVALGRVVAKGLGQVLQNLHSGSVAEGSGRLDALNRIGNRVFGEDMGIERNNAPTNAPVAFPHIWDTSWFDWVQYNGSIEQPMVRNAGEAMGVGAAVNFNEVPTPRFTSSIPVRVLYQDIEQQLAGPRPPLPARQFSGLRSPQWPGSILPPIDRRLAAQGEELYRELRCVGCHGPAPGTDAFWDDGRWTPANAAGERYLQLAMIPISHVGTDPAQAQGMRDRTVRVPASFGFTGAIGTSGSHNIYPYGPALGQAVERVVNRWYDSQTPPASPAERERMNGNRPNGLRTVMSYRARPLNGIWATSPYLHNGSVLTLWALLSPYAERRPAFSLGTWTFDPVRVGYVDGGPFRLDTTKAGNRNTGHLFDLPNAANGGVGIIGRPLTVEERRALVEYLKTL